jgi:hypothetical protein
MAGSLKGKKAKIAVAKLYQPTKNRVNARPAGKLAAWAYPALAFKSLFFPKPPAARLQIHVAE